MKNIIFYQEFKNKRKGISAGNVIAADKEIRISANTLVRDAIGAVFFTPDSPVATTAVALDYLHSHCKRVNETKAREIHPQLFVRLDA